MNYNYLIVGSVYTEQQLPSRQKKPEKVCL